MTFLLFFFISIFLSSWPAFEKPSQIVCERTPRSPPNTYKQAPKPAMGILAGENAQYPNGGLDLSHTNRETKKKKTLNRPGSLLNTM